MGALPHPPPRIRLRFQNHRVSTRTKRRRIGNRCSPWWTLACWHLAGLRATCRRRRWIFSARTREKSWYIDFWVLLLSLSYLLFIVVAVIILLLLSVLLLSFDLRKCTHLQFVLQVPLRKKTWKPVCFFLLIPLSYPHQKLCLTLLLSLPPHPFSIRTKVINGIKIMTRET